MSQGENLMDRREILGTASYPLAFLSHNPLISQKTTEPTKSQYRLGLVTYNTASTWNLDDLLQVCKIVGISPVELRTTHKHGVEPMRTRLERMEIRKKFADAGVEIWGCGSTCDFHWPDPQKVKDQIEECKQFVDLVADLGGKGVKVRPNDLPKGVPVEKTLEQIGKALIPCGKAASNSGIEIWVEVHGRGTSHPPHMKTIMEHCDLPNVGVTWNSNETDLKNGSISDYFRLLSPWIKSCHINDLYRSQPKSYPYRELFRLLREIRYDRATLIEVGKVWKDPKDGLEFLRYYKALWQELVNNS
ncbi:MAG: sugar phosphate isomerase/epimerase family protein [Gemmataceae bacterium]